DSVRIAPKSLDRLFDPCDHHIASDSTDPHLDWTSIAGSLNKLLRVAADCSHEARECQQRSPRRLRMSSANLPGAESWNALGVDQGGGGFETPHDTPPNPFRPPPILTYGTSEQINGGK